MNPGALFARLLDGDADDLTVRDAGGDAWSMPLGRWRAAAGAVDGRVLDRATGPVLDVGCGPGRHVEELERRGIPATGVELSPGAARHARARGARVVVGSIFDVAPNPGTWATALLLDGNIGIGGNPHRLLRRVADLLTDDGGVLVEVDPADPDGGGSAAAPDPATGPSRFDLPRDRDLDLAGPGDGSLRIRIETDGSASAWFPWARVTADTLARPAAAAGLVVDETWVDDGRHFCALARA